MKYTLSNQQSSRPRIRTESDKKIQLDGSRNRQIGSSSSNRPTAIRLDDAVAVAAGRDTFSSRSVDSVLAVSIAVMTVAVTVCMAVSVTVGVPVGVPVDSVIHGVSVAVRLMLRRPRRLQLAGNRISL